MPSSYFDENSLSGIVDNRYEDIAGNPFADALGFAQGWARKIGNQAQQEASKAYAQADRSLGGWLPGGGTPNALTSGYDKPTGRVAAIAKKTGVPINSFRVATLDRKMPLANQLAQAAGKAGINPWGSAAYAFEDPINGKVIGIRSNELDSTIVHELGHLQGSQIPDGGRVLQTVSNAIGNPAPLKFLAGAMLHLDAAEEDKAERFAAQNPMPGQTTIPKISSEGRSAYGDNLRKEGQNTMAEAFDPTGLIRSSASTMYGQMQTGIRNIKGRDTINSLNDVNTRLRSAVSEIGDADWSISPKVIKLAKEQRQLSNELQKIGYRDDEIFEMIKRR